MWKKQRASVWYGAKTAHTAHLDISEYFMCVFCPVGWIWQKQQQWREEDEEEEKNTQRAFLLSNAEQCLAESSWTVLFL